MNTQFEYMYRDAENYKCFCECVLNGIVEIDEIRQYLFSEEYFIPSEVGLMDLQKLPLHSYDHIWHEVVRLCLVDKPANTPYSAKQFIEMFRKASLKNWNEDSVIKRLDVM